MLAQETVSRPRRKITDDRLMLPRRQVRLPPTLSTEENHFQWSCLTLLSRVLSSVQIARPTTGRDLPSYLIYR